MQIKKFKDMYLAELQELLSAESQLGDLLKRAAEAASHPSLKDALKRHCLETLQQGDRVRSILQKHGADAQVHTDQAMQAIVAEAEKMMRILQGDDLRDAGLIASAQKIEHYEIAAYGTAKTLAGQLDLGEVKNLLDETLGEEGKADKLLTSIATGGMFKSGVNDRAATR